MVEQTQSDAVALEDAVPKPATRARKVQGPAQEMVGEKIAPVKKSKTVVFFSQFGRYSMPMQLDLGGELPQTVLVRFNDNRLELDPDDPVDKQIQERLLSNPRYTLDFNLMVASDIGTAVDAKAETLKRLNMMSDAELMRCFSPEELRLAGLPPNCQDREKLIVAFLATKLLA